MSMHISNRKQNAERKGDRMEERKKSIFSSYDHLFAFPSLNI